LIVTKAHKQLTLILVLFFLFVFAYLPQSAFEGDMVFWKRWIGYIKDFGFTHIYLRRDVEYHPFFLYCLYIFYKLQGSFDQVLENIYYIKLFPLIFDILGAVLIYLFIKIKWENILLPFFALLNVAYMYNTVHWGQVDSIQTFFAVAAVGLLLKGQLNWGLMAFILGINTKLQAMIFFPVVGIIWLLQVLKTPKKALPSIGLALLLQLIIVAPFIYGKSFSGLLNVVSGADSIHPYLSMNAYNFWFLFSPETLFGNPNMEITNPAKIYDNSKLVFGLNCKQVGLMMFFLASLIALLPFLFESFRQWKSKKELDFNFIKLGFLSCGLVSIIFFWFPTQMHERYLHPAILFFFIYAVLEKKWWLYGIVSLGYLLNMEGVLRIFKIHRYTTLIFDPRFIALIILLVLVLGTIKAYRLAPLGLSKLK